MPPRPSPTHFLCIPLVTSTSRPQLAQSLGSFRADITNANSFSVPADAVRPLGTLHLTLGVMSLPKGEVLSQAIQVLQQLKPRELWAGLRPLSASTPFTAGQAFTPASSNSAAKAKSPLGAATLKPSITLRGLHTMGNPAESTVLYAPPDDLEGMLYKFCEKLRGPFQEAGLMIDEGRPLLLHATIVNTIYVKGGGHHGRGRGGRQKLTLDATEILDGYADYIWMEGVAVEKIAICRMGAKKIEGEDEEAYEVEAEITV